MKAWQVDRKGPTPEWAHVAGHMDVDAQSIPDGDWLILRDGDPSVTWLHADAYALELKSAKQNAPRARTIRAVHRVAR